MGGKDTATLLHCRVTPKAKKSEILGWVEDGQNRRRLKIKLAAPPVDGKANQALVKFLGKKLGVPRSRIKLISGEKSRLKTVEIVGMDGAEVEGLLIDSRAGTGGA